MQNPISIIVLFFYSRFVHFPLRGLVLCELLKKKKRYSVWQTHRSLKQIFNSNSANAFHKNSDYVTVISINNPKKGPDTKQEMLRKTLDIWAAPQS